MPEPTTSGLGLLASLFTSNEGMAKISFAAGGLLGGLISLRFDKDMTRWQRVTALLTAMILGDIGGQPLADLVAGGKFAGGASVMVGLFGLSIFGTVLRGIKETDFAGIIKSFFDAVNARISGRQ